MKTSNSPRIRGSHNTLIQCFNVAEINPANIVLVLQYALRNPPKPRNIKEAIHYRVQAIHAERLIFLLTFQSPALAVQPVY